MTKIKFRPAPLWRESAHVFQRRALCVALEPCAVLVREKGRRTVYRVPIESVLMLGARLEVARRKAEKAEKRKNRKTTK